MKPIAKFVWTDASLARIMSQTPAWEAGLNHRLIGPLPAFFPHNNSFTSRNATLRDSHDNTKEQKLDIRQKLMSTSSVKSPSPSLAPFADFTSLLLHDLQSKLNSFSFP